MTHPFPPLQPMQQFLRVARSVQLARQMQAQPNHCFVNAWRTFVLNPEQFHDAHFVEGWLVVEQDQDIGLTEHGWIELPDHGIIDPSVLLIVSFTQPVFYAAGVRRTWQETEALEDQMFPHVRFDGLHGDDGLLHADYKAARDAALALVYARAFAHQPPKPIRLWVAQDLDDLFPSQVFQVERGLGDDSLDLGQSLVVAVEIKAQPEHYGDNARHALLMHPDLFWHPSYREGWLVQFRPDSLHLSEAAWIKDRGQVIDPTSVLDTSGPMGRIEYFPGVSWSLREMQPMVGCLLPAMRVLGTAHPMFPDYAVAYQQALARAELFAWKTGFPLMVHPARRSDFPASFWPLPLSGEDQS